MQGGGAAAGDQADPEQPWNCDDRRRYPEAEGECRTGVGE